MRIGLYGYACACACAADGTTIAFAMTTDSNAAVFLNNDFNFVSNNCFMSDLPKFTRVVSPLLLIY